MSATQSLQAPKTGTSVRTRFQGQPDTPPSYDEAVRRDSLLAQRLTVALAAAGWPGIRGRRLERWCAEGLGPTETASFVEQVEHFAELAELSTSGVDVDVTARRLTARGHVCSRTRSSILSQLGLQEVLGSPAALEVSTDPFDDVVFANLEQAARDMASDVSGLPSLMLRIIESFRRNAARYASAVCEPEDEIFERFVLNAIVYLFGDDLYDPAAIGATLKIGPRELTAIDLDFLNAAPRLDLAQITDYYFRAPELQIARMALYIVSVAPTILDHLEVAASLGEIEEFAALLAPGALCVIHTLSITIPEVADLETAITSLAVGASA